MKKSEAKIYGPRIHQNAFSNWHRNKLNSYCGAIDIDYLEFRRGKAVAIIEKKQIGENLTAMQEKYYNEVAEELEIHWYVIYGDFIQIEDEENISWVIKNDKVLIVDMTTNTKYETNEDGLIKFYENL